MKYCNYLLETHRVEAINQPGASSTNQRVAYTSRYWLDTVAIYLNSGDAYSPTILADLEENQFILTTFGDFVESLD